MPKVLQGARRSSRPRRRCSSSTCKTTFSTRTAPTLAAATPTRRHCCCPGAWPPWRARSRRPVDWSSRASSRSGPTPPARRWCRRISRHCARTWPRATSRPAVGARPMSTRSRAWSMWRSARSCTRPSSIPSSTGCCAARASTPWRSAASSPTAAWPAPGAMRRCATTPRSGLPSGAPPSGHNAPPAPAAKYAQGARGHRVRAFHRFAGMNRPLRTMRRAARVEADVHVAVAIVGGGACGLTAALMLHDAGVDCVVLERDALPSGSTALSSGFIPAPGTRAQRAHGVTGDSAARFAADIQAKARGRAAPALVDAYATAIGPALDALQQRHGLEWLLLDGFLYPGHSVRRMHALPQKTGRALMAALHAAPGAAGIPILTQAVVDTLVLDGAQRVLGIDYLRPEGRRETLGCAALLLACNGFGGNAQMVRTLLPEMAEARFCGHVGNDGSAIAWGRSLGARLRDLGGYQGHGSWVTPHGALMSWAVMMA